MPSDIVSDLRKVSAIVRCSWLSSVTLRCGCISPGYRCLTFDAVACPRSSSFSRRVSYLTRGHLSLPTSIIVCPLASPFVFRYRRLWSFIACFPLVSSPALAWCCFWPGIFTRRQISSVSSDIVGNAWVSSVVLWYRQFSLDIFVCGRVSSAALGYR